MVSGRRIDFLRSTMKGWVAGALAAAALAYSPAAQAQTQTFALDRPQVSGAPDDGFMVHRPRMDQNTRFYGNLALGFAHAPLRKDAVTGNPSTQQGMDDVITGQFIFYPSIGVEILGRIGFNMHLPFVPLQFSGSEPSDVGNGGLTGQYSSLGDIRFDARGVLWQSKDKATSFGVEGFFTGGSGTNTGFGGDRNGSAALFGSFEHDFGKWFLTGHLGPHFRPLNSIGGPEGDLVIGHELRWAFGGFMPLRGDNIRLGLELWGGTGIQSLSAGGEPNQNTFFSQRNTYLEWLGQVRVLLGEKKRFFANFGAGTRLSNGYGTGNFRMMASIGYFFRLKDKAPPSPDQKVQIVSRPEHYEADSDGDGYPDGMDNCPNDPEDGKPPRKTDGCPAEADRDEDGIPDRLDRCPDDKEDLDKIEDKDGCPEDDADKDMVLDKVDKCPTEPGPPNADKKLNGCPTLTKVTEDGTITLLKNIEFESGAATIKPVSYPILNEVLIFLKSKSEVRLAIHGHTDSVGKHETNLKLSKDRAAAVRKWLEGKGIAASRLESEGYGPDKPLQSNDTPEGRAKNRRVEFIVLETGDAAGGGNSGESTEW